MQPIERYELHPKARKWLVLAGLTFAWAPLILGREILPDFAYHLSFALAVLSMSFFVVPHAAVWRVKKERKQVRAGQE